MNSSDKRRQKRYIKRKKRRLEQRKKTVGQYDNFDAVASLDSLYSAFYLCRKGVAWKASVQAFQYDLLLHLYDLHGKLVAGISIRKGFVQFHVVERGKRRDIASVHISERCVQRSLCDNALYPVFERSIIYDNCACVRGAGTSRSEERLKKHLQDYYRKYRSNKGYIVLVDVTNYFGSIPHGQIIGDVFDSFYDLRIVYLYEDFCSFF